MPALNSLVIGLGSSESLVYCEHLGRQNRRLAYIGSPAFAADDSVAQTTSRDQFVSDTTSPGQAYDSIIIFDLLRATRDEALLARLDRLLEAKSRIPLFLISSIAAHLGGARYEQAERMLATRFGVKVSRLITLRIPDLRTCLEMSELRCSEPTALAAGPSETTLALARPRLAPSAHISKHVLSPQQPSEQERDRGSQSVQAESHRCTASCIDVAVLATAIDTESDRTSGRRRRTITLIGPNRCTLADGGSRSLGSLIPRRRKYQFDTLSPSSIDELLALYNPYSYPHLQLAGYNTGVQHFGWTFPGKTVIKTIGTGKRARFIGNRLDVDAGMTLKQAMEALRAAGKEFYVVPNYSYISMGTPFFVPIHGSGSEVSTLGSTIEKAMIYLPDEDRILRIKRGDDQFDRYLYSPRGKALVLRLTYRVRDRTRYFVRQSTLASLAAQDVVDQLSDPEAVNVEIRKSHAADCEVTIRRYYEHNESDNGSGEVLEVPKDSLGKIWDRLEETPVVSRLFHEFVKRCGYHVELFLSEQQFERFWQSHQQLPLRKIQLRKMKQDGMMHSPCRDSDRISADIFMKRADKDLFLDYVNQHLPDVQFNPGKHSK